MGGNETITASTKQSYLSQIKHTFFFIHHQNIFFYKEEQEQEQMGAIHSIALTPRKYVICPWIEAL